MTLVMPKTIMQSVGNEYDDLYVTNKHITYGIGELYILICFKLYYMFIEKSI